VRPNTLLHADANGVTTIPRDIAPEVADAAAEFLAAEAVLAKAMTSGAVTMEILLAARREKGEMVSALRARVSRKQ
jgi:regulator of RNase E activity RraA